MKMRKMVAALLAVLMLCSIIPFSAAAEAASATIDFTDKANRVSYSTEQQVWAQNGITVTNDKGASTSNVGDYGGDGYPVRFYKGSSVTVEYSAMTKIEFYCDDYKASYATDLATSITDGTVTVDGTVVTVVFDAAVDSLVIETLAAQVRVDSITVYGEGGGTVVPPVDPEPEEPEEPVEPDIPVEPASSAVIDFTTLDSRVSCSTSQQVWQQNGITFTNDKGASTSNVNEKYYNPVRCYKSSTVTIEYPGMTKIVIDSVTYSDNDYAIGWTNSFSADATATVVDGDVTIVLAEAADVFVWEQLTAQSRAYTITVYTGEGGDTPVDPEPDTPVDPPVSGDPEADTELSIADAIALGASKEHNTYTEGKYFVGGYEIVEVYNTQYGNMKIQDGEGNILTIYGTWNYDGTVRYDAMDVQLVAGDVVWLYGIIGQYNGTPQMKNGWIVNYIVGGDDGPGEGGETPDVPVQPDEPVGEWGVIANPVAGVAYKFGMVQQNVSSSDVYYLIGGMAQTYYLATGTDAASALDVYLEETDGGYYLYAMVNGVKQYINMVVSGTHVNGAYEASASTVYTFDADYGTVIAEIDGAYYWFGTRNDKTYTTVGPCNVEYAGFYCQFYGESDGGDTPVDPPVDPEPDVPVEPPVSDEIETDYPFLFGMIQYNVSEEDVYFLAGGMDSYYMATTTNPDEAIVVYVEATDGGYYFYTYDGDTKLYINMVVSGTHVNGAYEATASTVYRYDAEAGTLIAEVNGADYWFGTRNDKTYTTVGPCKVEYEGFYCEFYYFSEEEECEHEYDNDCDDECNLCGEIREVGEHVYDDEYDADCNICGEIREVPEKPVYVGSIAVSTNSAAVGENVIITIQVDNNPGIVSAKVKVYFDNTVLKFVSAEAGEFSASGYSWSDPDAVQEKGYVVVNWCDATKPDSMAQLLATLTFEVLEGAEEGFYDIIPEFNCAADVFNAADETVWFHAVSGGVQIVAAPDVMPGDIDGNGKVNNRDLALMQQHINGWDVEVDMDAADVDGNDKINNRDLALLQQYINGWDVELI